MINLTIKHNFGTISRELVEIIESQVGFAARQTANDLAFAIKRDTDAEMAATFHKPTRFTMQAMRVVKDSASPREATSSAGIPMAVPRKAYSAYVGMAQPGMPTSNQRLATVVADDAWTRALAHQFGGGMRRYKRWEAALYAKKVLPPGYYAVPASGCPMDRYDNPVPGFMVQLLAYFSAYKENGFRANMTAKGRAKFDKRMSAKIGGTTTQFFISKGKSGADPGVLSKAVGYNSVPMGIWQRYQNGADYRIKPIFLFYRASSYNQLIPFTSIAISTFRYNAQPLFEKNMKWALRTAKRRG